MTLTDIIYKRVKLLSLGFENYVCMMHISISIDPDACMSDADIFDPGPLF